VRWVDKRLDELGFVSRGRSRHRPRNAEHLYGGPYPFIQTGDVKHSELYVASYEQTYSEAGLAQSKLWPAGTLCITIAANIAETAILAFEACFPDSVIGFMADEQKSDVRFIKYTFDTLKHRFQQVSQGVAQDNLSLEKLLSIKLRVPAQKQDQADIAKVLTAYDEAIENNRRRMALLEKAARLLYEEWFVRLRFPGHEHAPIKDGVPKGWAMQSIANVTSFLKRGIAPRYDEEAPGLVVNQKCIRNGILDLALARNQSREFAAERQVQVGDVLVNSTGEGTLGRVAQVCIPIENCTVDTHVTIVRPKPEIPLNYFGRVLMAWEPRFSTMGRGATNQTELSPTAIGEVEILIPQKTVAKEFEALAAPISTQVANLLAQNNKLRAARDLLLPRLMSGEIEV
jgi:type I restriction enzyme S subunit